MITLIIIYMATWSYTIMIKLLLYMNNMIKYRNCHYIIWLSIKLVDSTIIRYLIITWYNHMIIWYNIYLIIWLSFNDHIFINTYIIIIWLYIWLYMGKNIKSPSELIADFRIPSWIFKCANVAHQTTKVCQKGHFCRKTHIIPIFS
jgi:hypothetical protein